MIYRGVEESIWLFQAAAAEGLKKIAKKLYQNIFKIKNNLN
jgi:hypothetical protein